MKIFLFAIVVLVSINNAISDKYKFVESVKCVSDGIKFTFSKDSILYENTGLMIDLYTGNNFEKPVDESDFKPGTFNVNLKYDDYIIRATTLYGENRRPLLYDIEQRFFAVPKTGYGKNNYTFTVTCIIPATYIINKTTNTSDDIHGEPIIDPIEPEKSVRNEILGLRPDGGTALGDRLTFVVSLKDDIYSALIPLNCKYYNPNDPREEVTFVSNQCPQPLPNEDYFGTMKRDSGSKYTLSFRAFAFENGPNSLLGIECDVMLCIHQNVGKCNKSCWFESVTTEAPTTNSPTTEPEQRNNDEKQVRVRFNPIRNRRSIDETDIIKEDTGTATVKENAVFHVDTSGDSIPKPCEKQQVCNNTELLTALYGVIGGLCILLVFLILTLVYLACVERRGKVDPNQGPFFVGTNPLLYYNDQMQVKAGLP